MREPWWQRCHACGCSTAPVHRKERRCPKCRRDPRSPRQRVVDAVMVSAVVLGVVLAAPAILVFGVAFELDEHERRRRAAKDADRE